METYQHHPKWSFIRGQNERLCKCEKCSRQSFVPWTYYPQNVPLARPAMPDPYAHSPFGPADYDELIGIYTGTTTNVK
jgi:hypothetical protein